MSDDGNDRWVRVTAVGDLWDVEISESGIYYRHRRILLGRPGVTAEWSPGRPPSGVHARDQSP